MLWRNIRSLMWPIKKSNLISLWTGLDFYLGTEKVLLQVVAGLPLLITDGLLVRYTLHSFNFS